MLAAERPGDSSAAIGRVRKRGEGLSRETFFVTAERAAGETEVYAVSLPRATDPALDARTQKEFTLLHRLSGYELPFRVPEPVGVVRDDVGLALVTRAVAGISLPMKAGTPNVAEPFETIAAIAAAIHHLPQQMVADVASGYSTRREHARAALAAFDGLRPPEFADAHAWCEEHLPPDDPAALLHGDLLGQNIFLGLDAPPTVLDWEYATSGDHAYNLAVATRGARRPFGIARGLEALLAAYHQSGGACVTRAHVRLHDLCFVASWYRQSLACDGAEPPDQYLARFRNLLRRAKALHEADARP